MISAWHKSDNRGRKKLTVDDYSHEKTCPDCGKTKNRWKDFHAERCRPDGRSGYCIECRNDRIRRRKALKQATDNWPEQFRASLQRHAKNIQAWRELAAGHKAGVIGLTLRQFERTSYFFYNTSIVMVHDPDLY